MTETALLALEDGTLWRGLALGARGERTGEVVFNTSMTGYQEVLTDPSYYQQIVVMTASHIGNTGVNRDDDESARAWLAGFAVREASRRVSNWRATASLDDYLRERNVVGISDLDTRALVRHLRSQGAMRGALSSDSTDPARLIEMARTSPSMNGADLVRYVTCNEPYYWDESIDEKWYALTPRHSSLVTRHVLVLDYGVKRNTLRSLTARGCRVTIVPAQTSSQEILALKPDGILLSNGPGDPAAVTYAIETLRAILGRIPIMGICLGHQILGLALGGDTYKLKFGHRGGNQPVKNLLTGQVEITTHNHGFAVRTDSLPKDIEVTHINLNDQCVEGLRTRDQRAFSVQFHPEAAPGPHDAMGLFDEFIAIMEKG
ncbi:MAG: glutamine-hydrolyzing carbamoyl-phosphate synthase small subunit [Chloroflexi bacterium]|nr:glutamine-hydrolyzing carbamoyl-phosphate synthase small subunit [Chloroflexota bacterium]